MKNLSVPKFPVGLMIVSEQYCNIAAENVAAFIVVDLRFRNARYRDV